jgi:GntR family transcriptional regulator/MocR family aminotransferase
MAMTDFIREGHFSRHIKRMRTIYMERHKAMVEAIREQAHELLEVVGERAGLYVIALLPDGIDDVELADTARQMRIPAGSLSRCYASPPARGGLLLGYANVDMPEIPGYVRSLKALIQARMPRHS